MKSYNLSLFRLSELSKTVKKILLGKKSENITILCTADWILMLINNQFQYSNQMLPEKKMKNAINEGTIYLCLLKTAPIFSSTVAVFHFNNSLCYTAKKNTIIRVFCHINGN